MGEGSVDFGRLIGRSIVVIRCSSTSDTTEHTEVPIYLPA